jgi:hypothetical protein
MKKILVVLLALAFAATLFSACAGGDNGGGGGSSWMGAGLARSVDKQFGPVTLGANGAKRGEVVPATLANDQDGGTHQVKALKGKVNKVAVLDVVRLIDESWLGPMAWGGGINLPGKKGDLVSKISTLASAHSVDNNPCEHDSNMNGIPDVKEARCDAVTDPTCTGLCDDPASVKCTGSGKTFNIKFSDCVQVDTSTTWTVTSVSTDTTTVSCAGVWQVKCDTAATVDQTLTVFTTNTTTTTNSNFVPNAAGPSTEVTDCGSTIAGTWTTTTNTHTGVVTNTCGPVVITNCTDATMDTTNATMVNTGVVTDTTGTWITTSTATIWNGGVALNYGVSNTDEQLYHTRYNKLTKVWDDNGAVGGFATVDNAPFVTLSGQKMEYRVVDPDGFATDGTTCRYLNGPAVPRFNCEDDGMEISHVNVMLDFDGKDGTVYPTSKVYPTKRGMDWEDGMFVFTGAGSAIVNYLGSNLVDIDDTGVTLDLFFFDKDNPGDYLCETSGGTPCVVQVKMNDKTRLFSVLSTTCDDVKVDTDVKF